MQIHPHICICTYIYNDIDNLQVFKFRQKVSQIFKTKVSYIYIYMCVFICMCMCAFVCSNPPAYIPTLNSCILVGMKIAK